MPLVVVRRSCCTRSFVGLNVGVPVWDVTLFTNAREHVLQCDVARAFFQRVLAGARERRLLSDEHFTVDGTLIAAWARQKNFQRKDGAAPPEDARHLTGDFCGEVGTNAAQFTSTRP